MSGGESIEVKLARIEERIKNAEKTAEETKTDVRAIRDIFDQHVPRWISTAERVDLHHRVLWAMMLPILGAVGLAIWLKSTSPH